MIIKSYEFNKINFSKINYYLLYGKNDGLKKEIINYFTIKNIENSYYEEREILENQSRFLESLGSGSLFEDKKTIIIKRSSEKLFKIIEELISKNFENLKVIIDSDNLEKKSKLRSLFEKSKECICIPIYPDNEQSLLKLTHFFIKERKISISNSDINLIINKCRGDRGILLNELNKIELFSLGGKRISSENIAKITNLIENYSVSELIDNCLAKNKKKIIQILNENNFNKEDTVMIIRTFLNKSKKLLKLCKDFELNKNIDITISTAKPPIFWKDKDITKKQIQEWDPQQINRLIYDLNEVELQIKKNLEGSINLVSNFILEKTISKTNSKSL